MMDAIYFLTDAEGEDSSSMEDDSSEKDPSSFYWLKWFNMTVLKTDFAYMRLETNILTAAARKSLLMGCDALQILLYLEIT